MPPPHRVPDVTFDRFGEKLRALRKERDWTQAEVARAVGYDTHSQISEMETGKKGPPSPGQLVKLARLFGVPTEALLADDVDLPPDVVERA